MISTSCRRDIRKVLCKFLQTPGQSSRVDGRLRGSGAFCGSRKRNLSAFDRSKSGSSRSAARTVVRASMTVFPTTIFSQAACFPSAGCSGHRRSARTGCRQAGRSQPGSFPQPRLAQIPGSQAGFDMTDPAAGIKGRQCGRQSGGRVAVNEHPGGRFRGKHGPRPSRTAAVT